MSSSYRGVHQGERVRVTAVQGEAASDRPAGGSGLLDGHHYRGNGADELPVTGQNQVRRHHDVRLGATEVLYYLR